MWDDMPQDIRSIIMSNQKYCQSLTLVENGRSETKWIKEDRPGQNKFKIYRIDPKVPISVLMNV
ncbi:MAG: hypothetical protein WCR96_00375 [Candidatus Methanomethylophilaceae archaeon]